ncbi:LytTR family DNA-binding domain-containing protein [Bizionia paragorgiae]|jgi:two-component system, LytTR family, response regulator|uniref:LytR/AlgR family response regulator transcription factor n=1 Tax=Bizionia paragorgiae TaxID=283786 RepID=UPI00299F4DB1|nr:LytTR family DNA-binding domain-containing protein [Bizionia paragorgiae]MDX1271071.1 LytTR family DNA-binding domain-containing protein [Bizionia paragorgiae]
MSKLSAVIIDDEISNLKGLEQKLEKLFPEIQVVNTFQKPEDAIAALKIEQPDIVFLDIEMPRINGFDLLAQLVSIHFQVIFVTAYSDYAIEAFKQNAVDYILKPIDDEDLKLAINKAITLVKGKKEVTNNDKLVSLLTSVLSNNKKIIVPTSKGLSFIPQEDVLHLEGYEGYTKIHVNNAATIMSSYNLGRFEKLLGHNFFKCHKSHIVNLERVRHFENEGYLLLENEQRVPISKTNKKAFLDLFK